MDSVVGSKVKRSNSNQYIYNNTNMIETAREKQ